MNFNVQSEVGQLRQVIVHRPGLELPEGRAFVLDRGCTPEMLGPNLVPPPRKLFDDLDGPALAEFLVGGVLKADLHPSRARSLKWDVLRADDSISGERRRDRESPGSIVFGQAENRLHTIKGLMVTTIGTPA